MGIQQQLAIRSSVLKGHVNKYTMLGLFIAFGSIILATALVSYQLTGSISLIGMLKAQATNPAIWALDLTPFMFAYWGQSFCVELANKAESIIEDKEREYAHKSEDLESKLKYESSHDSLTNLPNIKLLSDRVDQAIQHLKPDEESTALIILSINHFKEINFNVGSFSANSLLVQFAEKLKSLLLEPYFLQAYMGMNMVARVQSAEFALLIPRLRKEHELNKILKYILNETASTYMIDGHKVEVTTTLGVAIHPPHGRDAHELIEHASLALISADKENLRSCMFEENMAKQLKSKRVLINELHKAVQNEEFDILYAPVVDLKSEKTIGFDTQIHFHDEKYHSMTHERLISTADGTDVLKRLSVSTLQQVLDVLEKLYKSNQNIYMRVFIFEAIDPQLPGIIRKLLAEKNIPPKCLKLELTEQSCLSNQSKTIDVLNELNELGIGISISDFGSGYSSFIYLTNFPIKEVKIDKSFTHSILSSERKKHIVEAIIKMAGALGLSTVAGGVDSQEIKQALQNLGCDYAEGECFSKSLPAEKVHTILAST